MHRNKKWAIVLVFVLALSVTSCSEADLITLSTGGQVSFETGFEVDSLDQLLSNFFFVAVQIVSGMQYGGF